MVMYGTYLSYRVFEFFLKEKGNYTVQELAAKLMPEELATKRQRTNAYNRVRRCCEQLVFEQKLLKETTHIDNNLFAYKYSIPSYESKRTENGD